VIVNRRSLAVHDLILTDARLIDPASGRDETTAIAYGR